MQNLIDGIQRDHHLILALVSRLSPELSLCDQENLYNELRLEVEAHIAEEEQVIYPLLDEAQAKGYDVPHSRQEHDRLRAHIHVLDSMTVGSPEWWPQLAVLKKNLTGHIHVEETRLFPLLRWFFPQAKLSAQLPRLDHAREHVYGRTLARHTHS